VIDSLHKQGSEKRRDLWILAVIEEAVRVSDYEQILVLRKKMDFAVSELSSSI